MSANSSLEILTTYMSAPLIRDIDIYMGVYQSSDMWPYDKSIKWLNFDNRHSRANNPACLYYFDNGRLEEWHMNGVRYRPYGKPSMITYDRDDRIIQRIWFADGKMHRLNGPSYINYYNNGNKRQEIWYQDGEQHRLDDPASINYDSVGNIISQQWTRNGYSYRCDDTPDFIVYSDNGDPKEAHWYRRGIDQTDGPVSMIHNEHNNTIVITYFKEGGLWDDYIPYNVDFEKIWRSYV